MSPGILAIVIAAVSAVPASSEKAPADLGKELLSTGIRQYAAGDFEAAVFSLDTAVRRLEGQAGRSAELCQAYLYSGAAFVGLDNEDAARGKFKKALAACPALSPPADQLPPRALAIFQTEALKRKATKSRSARKWAIIGGGAVAAGAVGVATLTRKTEAVLPANRAPAVAIGVSPEGQALVNVTNMKFTATASDPDGDAVTVDWDLGDGTTARANDSEHVYVREGTFTVTATATDAKGLSTRASATVVARSVTGTWKCVLISNPLTWTQSGSSFSIGGSDQYGEYGGGRLAPPRQVSFDCSFTYFAQGNGHYSGGLDASLNQVLMVQQGGAATSMTCTRQ